MATVMERPAVEPTVADKATDALRQAAHASHEVRLLKSLAADAAADATHAARRAMKSVRRDAADLTDDAIYRVKREPVKAMALAFGAGLLLGAVAMWIGRRQPKPQPTA